MAMNIVSGSQLNASKVSYTKPKINASGGKSVGLTYEGSIVRISTPLMLTWGVNENDFDGSGKFTYDMSLQFPRDNDANDSPQNRDFLANLAALEEKIKNDALTHGREWFGKAHKNREVIDALWSPMLKYPKDKETGEPDTTRAPSIRVKLPYWDGNFKMEIFNINREMLFPNDQGLSPVDLIQKGQNVALVIQSGGLWFANGKFGMTWRLVQAVVQPKASILGNRTCHVPIDGDVRAGLEAERAREESEAADTGLSSTQVADSEDEDDVEEEEDAPAPAPTPAPVAAPAPSFEAPAPEKKKVKRVVRKKKVIDSDM
jgi:hypothetical protein